MERQLGKRKLEEVQVDETEPESTEEEKNDLTEDDILKLVEEAPEVPPLDLAGLRQYVSNLERAILKNQQMRVKYADDPKKFMESEIKLDECIKVLQELAPQPQLYSDFVKMQGLTLILSLMTHENTDIASSVIELLNELTEPDSYTEEPSAVALADHLLDGTAMEVFVENLDRLDEKNSQDDSQAVYNTLSILENLTEIRPSACQTIVESSKILDFLIRRMEQPKIDDNKLYASELLAILLGEGGGDTVRRKLGEGGIFRRLVDLANIYNRKDLGRAEEVEYFNNIIDCMCSALMFFPNQVVFAQARGISVTIGLIKKSEETRSGALKVLDFALMRCPSNCEIFVDESGLKTLFAAFMLKGKKSKKAHALETSNEEHIVSMIAQLFMNVADVRYGRLFNKFRENDYEKLERLIELHDKYARRIEDAEIRRARELEEEEEEDDEDDEEKYARRIESGLFTLQMVDLVVSLVATANDEGVKERTIQLLNQQDRSLDDIKIILQEWVNHMDDEQGVANTQKAIILNLIEML
eukprot:TRINITY_DN2552_c0_g2_i2.p1 TRINITY_DN2552_c0_g2~~TRINITY_DN2552_c0_g2_i2.p1  ORF type:complete len:529 (-),score=111.18 TRINITY_DN2552_c0_g2_i2:168-1754(-)